MRNRYSPNRQYNSIRQKKDAFFVDSPALERMQKADRAVNSALKAILWLGYGFALASWFVAVNIVILFAQLLKMK
ncbi:MAG: hypothetical protein ACPHQ9_03600 [Marinobacter sp.]|uniref:hypothetical protein n=1 Tax=Marinobacter sp. TaxID=50741 RepID=UPI003C35CE97